ncbi:MAG: hypothetical protein FWG30_08905 [Eubacteriaceae bacterium]|jgi:hypothetical protein|nr:hypothetical protein [Eubacteriaceae bacterium]
MIYRLAEPSDGLEMLKLIESHASSGGMNIIYTRRPDAYRSYKQENPGSEIMLCVSDTGSLLGQVACLPVNVYFNGKAVTIGYINGLHQSVGKRANIMRMLDAGDKTTPISQYYCSVLDGNEAVYTMFARRGILKPICSYTTYFIHPCAIKPVKHAFSFRRAQKEDEGRLVRFYREFGSKHDYFPEISDLNSYSGLSVSDFYIFEDSSGIAAAGAIWNQMEYKQYIAMGYSGFYRLASYLGPVLEFFRYPALPKKGEAANFAYISFLLTRGENPGVLKAMLSEIASAGSQYGFLALGASGGDILGQALKGAKSIKLKSRICSVGYGQSNLNETEGEICKFELAML